MKEFKDFERNDLMKLRKEIIFGSFYIGHYVNSFGINKEDMYTFFDGYYDFLKEQIEEESGYSKRVSFNDILERDNIDNLMDWFQCSDDYSWIRYVEE